MLHSVHMLNALSVEQLVNGNHIQDINSMSEIIMCYTYTRSSSIRMGKQINIIQF